MDPLIENNGKLMHVVTKTLELFSAYIDHTENLALESGLASELEMTKKVHESFIIRKNSILEISEKIKLDLKKFNGSKKVNQVKSSIPKKLGRPRKEKKFDIQSALSKYNIIDCQIKLYRYSPCVSETIIKTEESLISDSESTIGLNGSLVSVNGSLVSSGVSISKGTKRVNKYASCQICDKQYTRDYNLRRHMQRNHLGE